MRAAGLLERVSAVGVAAQASVTALYAWGVTVAPVAWRPGVSSVARVSAAAALLTIGAGVAAERRWGASARVPAFWAFVLTSALTWSVAPAALAPLRVDTSRGIAGMLSWALVALAFAAPALEGRAQAGRPIDSPSSPEGKSLRRGDSLY